MTKNIEKRTVSNHSDLTPPFKVGPHWASVEGKPLTPEPDLARRIRVRSSQEKSGNFIPMHSHVWGQLLFLTEGLVEVSIKDLGCWVVPPQRAVWLPSYIEHSIKIIHSVQFHNVYIAPQYTNHITINCQVINVSNLLRELIIAIAKLPILYDESAQAGRLVDVFLDQFSALEEIPLYLPTPTHPALLKITAALQANPETQYSLLFWQKTLGISSRTLARKFLIETGMTYSQWRQQAKLLSAVQRIAQGDPIANIAFDLGYQSQSAFISMFKKALGKTPGKYFD